MTWRVIYSAEALADLDDLRFYVASNLKSPQTADALVSEIIDRANSLDTFPFRFARYNISPLMERGVRFFTVNNYLVLYLPDEAGHAVSILRILYGGSDIVARLSVENQELPSSQLGDSFSDTHVESSINDNADIPSDSMEDGRLIFPPSWRNGDDN